MVTTPGFDRVASEGVRFRNAYAPAPGCSPTRAAFLTGRHIWMIEQAGTHASSFPAKYVSYQDLLEDAGYAIGYTGKPWGPGRWEKSGRTRNPAGPPSMKRTLEPPYQGIRDWDYAGNFEDFYESKPEGQPFSFWVGGSEAHRVFERGLGRLRARASRMPRFRRSCLTPRKSARTCSITPSRSSGSMLMSVGSLTIWNPRVSSTTPW